MVCSTVVSSWFPSEAVTPFTVCKTAWMGVNDVVKTFSCPDVMLYTEAEVVDKCQVFSDDVVTFLGDVYDCKFDEVSTETKQSVVDVVTGYGSCVSDAVLSLRDSFDCDQFTVLYDKVVKCTTDVVAMVTDKVDGTVTTTVSTTDMTTVTSTDKTTTVDGTSMTTMVGDVNSTDVMTTMPKTTMPDDMGMSPDAFSPDAMSPETDMMSPTTTMKPFVSPSPSPVVSPSPSPVPRGVDVTGSGHTSSNIGFGVFAIICSLMAYMF